MAKESEKETSDQNADGNPPGDAKLEGLKEESGALFRALWNASSLCEAMAPSHSGAAQASLGSVQAYMRMAVEAEVSIANALGILNDFLTQAAAVSESNASEALMALEKRTHKRARAVVSYVEESESIFSRFTDAAIAYIHERGSASREVDAAEATVAAHLGAKAIRLALARAREFHDATQEVGV